MNLQSPTRTAHLRHLSDLAAERFLVSLTRAELETCRYNPDQPRVPAGQPGGGQWGSGEGGGDADDGRFDVAGGFDSEHLKMSVQSFVARYCRGDVRAELPSQFLNMEIGDVVGLAKGGDASAKKCYKILNQDRFRKRR